MRFLNLTKNNITLEPCPFCGSDANIHRKYYKDSTSLNRPNETEGVANGQINWIGCFNPSCWQPKVYAIAALLDLGINQWNERKQ
jgi:hypothetical protein